MDTRVTLHNTSSGGGGTTISTNEDGTRCVVAGREGKSYSRQNYKPKLNYTEMLVLRILRVDNTLPPEDSTPPITHGKSATGPGGSRALASHNYWKGSGLKIDSAFTDVCWGASCMSSVVSERGNILMGFAVSK